MSYGTVETPLAAPDWNLAIPLHNWLNTVQVETSFQTVITSAADSVSEERRALLGYPGRIVSFSWTGLSRSALNKILINLRNISSGTWVAPLYPDQAPLTVAYASGTTLYCSTLLRRFFAGGRVVVLGLGTSGEVDHFEFQTIDSVADAHLVLDGELSNTYSVGRTLIMPCIDVMAVLDPQIDFHTRRAGSVNIVAQEVVGPSLLPGWEGVPSGFSTFQDIPILHIEHNWVQDLSTTFLREGSHEALGRGMVTHLRGDRARVSQTVSVLMEREDALGLLRFFECRLGRTLPFWMPDPENVWDPLALGASSINIEPEGEFEDFEADLEYVAIRDINGDVTVREVDEIVDNSTYWTVSFTSALPVGLLLANISSVARARLVRFDSDAMEETWHTDETMETQFSVIELLEEGEVE